MPRVFLRLFFPFFFGNADAPFACLIKQLRRRSKCNNVRHSHLEANAQAASDWSGVSFLQYIRVLSLKRYSYRIVYLME